MKTRLITLILLILSCGLSAQTTLTYQDNALISGDSNACREIQFTDPGNAGANQIWDFSKIQYNGNTQVSSLQNASLPKTSGAGDYNLSLLENGYDYFMNSSERNLEERGYVNKDAKLTLVYSDPVVKMVYPFSFGQQFSDHFIGIAYYSETNTIDFFGDCTVTADGNGTLILPDRTLEGVLRVKSIKKGLQINMCGTTDVNIAKYSWYAPGYRYPILNISIVENTTNGAAPVITKTAFTNTQQINTKSALLGSIKSAGLIEPVKQSANSDIAVVFSPNPFTDKLTYNYLLPEQNVVSIELYDLSGKTIAWLVKGELQTSGMQTGELLAGTYGLTPGIYFMRFTFNKQVVICKVVKI